MFVRSVALPSHAREFILKTYPVNVLKFESTLDVTQNECIPNTHNYAFGMTSPGFLI